MWKGRQNRRWEWYTVREGTAPAVAGFRSGEEGHKPTTVCGMPSPGASILTEEYRSTTNHTNGGGGEQQVPSSAPQTSASTVGTWNPQQPLDWRCNFNIPTWRKQSHKIYHSKLEEAGGQGMQWAGERAVLHLGYQGAGDKEQGSRQLLFLRGLGQSH